MRCDKNELPPDLGAPFRLEAADFLRYNPCLVRRSSKQDYCKRHSGTEDRRDRDGEGRRLLDLQLGRNIQGAFMRCTE